MEIKTILNEILNGNCADLFIYRMFNKCPYSQVIVSKTNDLLNEDPNTLDIILALFIYPAMKWSTKGFQVNESMKIIEELKVSSDRIHELTNIQKIITDATMLQPKLLLKQRDAYLTACQELINLIDESIKYLGDFPIKGQVYKETVEIFTVSDCGHWDRAIFRKLEKNLIPAIKIISAAYSNRYEEAMDKVLTESPSPTISDKNIYHNTELLINEYVKILWYSKYSDDTAVRLLYCKSEQEMVHITKKDDTYAQAFIIAEYIKMISTAIDIVKEFPKDGEEYYNILTGIVSHYNNGLTYEDTAHSLGMSLSSFEVKKKRACAVLGTLLWGCDGDLFITLLAEKRR